MSDFTHLHLHTEYSLLDGANKIDELADVLKERGVKSVAITDHGNMFGAIEFYKTMKSRGIKPIIGIEAYLHNGDTIDDKSDKSRFHVILLAKDEQGYKNLMKLSSLAYLDGFYRNPRINKKTLKEHSKGLICSSACLAGEVNFHLNLSQTNIQRGAKGYERAKEVALEYRDIFGDDFYLEIMRHGIKEQENIDKEIIRLSKETGIKLVATNDAHYTYKERAEAHEIFMCIATGATIGDESRLRHDVCEFYVKTKEEMNALFADIPEAIESTQEIANKCNLEIELGNATPPNFKFTIEYAKERGLELPYPDVEYSLENDAVLFEYESKKGLEERLKFIDEKKHDIYRQRLQREIKIIEDMKFPGYMLIVADFINEAKKRAIPVGPGRGSAAGSLVAYSLKITDLDPIPYNLLFERFLNPERVSMPDIDVDFCQFRRGEVIDYVISKYGKYNVAQVATFGKLLARGVIRDVARVLEMPLKDSDKMAKMVPEEIGITLNGKGDVGTSNYKPGAYQKEEKLRELIESDPLAAQVWKYALPLEGLNRQAGMHAAGIVISNEELWNKTPLFRQTKGQEGQYITQYSKDYLEEVDLIKFDFLGLKTLTVIDNAVKLVKRRYNKDIVWEEIDFNQKEVYETIQSGNTLGIFQIEGDGMQRLGSELRPDNFEDIIAMLALYRPGPLGSGMVTDFIKRKHKEIEITYNIEELKDILEPTYGVIVYQEQVMQIVQKIGGFTLGGADIVRRAMGKKKESEMVRLKNQYLEGAVKNGFDRQKADDLFELIMKFAEYGFNKSHSAAYALITFQTAYLKTFYPAEFMAALLTSEEDNLDKVAKYIDEIKRLDIEILPPCLNNSYREFSVIQKDGKDAIVFGMGALKGVGLGAIDNIIECRSKDGEFKSLNDFVSRIDSFAVNKRAIEAFILSGAMDLFGYTRKCLEQNIQNILDACKASNKMKKEADNSLFDLEDIAYEVDVAIEPVADEFSTSMLLSFEKDILGIYLSGHPLDEYRELISKVKYSSSRTIFEDDNFVGERLMVGRVEDIAVRMTKSGKKMGIMTLLDLDSSYQMVAFDKELKEFEKLYEQNSQKPYVFEVRVVKDESQTRITMLRSYEIEDMQDVDYRGKNYNQRGLQNSTNRQKLQIYQYEIDFGKLNRENIIALYNLAHDSFKNNPNNYKRLQLKIYNKDEIYLYNTDLFIDDEFIKKAEILLAG